MTYHFIELFAIMVQQTNEIGRRTRCEPVILYAQMTETFQNTEGIEDIGHPFAKMIPVISVFQYLNGLLFIQIQFVSQKVNGITKYRQQFIFGNSTQRLVISYHTDVIRLVESTENTHLRELGNTRQ